MGEYKLVLLVGEMFACKDLQLGFTLMGTHVNPLEMSYALKEKTEYT